MENCLAYEAMQDFSVWLWEGYNPVEPFKISLKKIWLNLLNVLLKKYRESIFHEQYYHSPYSKEENIKLSNELMIPMIQIIERGKKPYENSDESLWNLEFLPYKSLYEKKIF